MCSMVLKESIECYVNNGSRVYCTMLDATKAFDRVRYCKLFRLLLERNIPPVVIRILVNMYTNHSVCVSWNGVQSDCFVVKNGVKQGGVVSPVLFCIYLNGLLCELEAAGVGCFVGRMFVCVLAYADDIVLIAPTPYAMRKLLGVCDEYASCFSIMFNAKKSKCLIIQPSHRACNCVLPNPTFYIGGNTIEIVDRWPHLGHVIDDRCNDGFDIMNRQNSMVGQINNVLCYFNRLGVVTKLRLLEAYCSSLYGCELWDLCHDGIDDICTMWRKGLRSVWSLPSNTHCALLAPPKQ
jgi:hypothetical protein